VKQLLGAWLLVTALATVALLLARLLEPGRFELELDVYVLAIGGLALLLTVVHARKAYPREEQSAVAAALEREPAEAKRPPELERLERELTMATATAFDLHSRLRPLVREIAGMRLATHGLRLDDAEGALGPELWEIARPDRTSPSNRHAEGISPAALRRVVEELEAL